MCIPLPIDSPSLPSPSPPHRRNTPRTGQGQNSAAAEIYLFFLPRHRTFNTGSCYEPVLKGGPKCCGSPTCATL